MWSKEEKKTQDSERIINSKFELQFERAILWSDPLPTDTWTGSSHKTLLQMKCSVVLPLCHMFALPQYSRATLNSNLPQKSLLLSQAIIPASLLPLSPQTAWIHKVSFAEHICVLHTNLSCFGELQCPTAMESFPQSLCSPGQLSALSELTYISR